MDNILLAKLVNLPQNVCDPFSEVLVQCRVNLEDLWRDNVQRESAAANNYTTVIITT